MAECIFCKIIAGEISSEKIFESNSFIVIKDVAPKSIGHVLVIPKMHWVTLLDIPNKFGNELLEILKKVSESIIDSRQGDGFNIVMNNLECAGQVVKHAHIHIIPRIDNDGLKII